MLPFIPFELLNEPFIPFMLALFSLVDVFSLMVMIDDDDDDDDGVGVGDCGD